MVLLRLAAARALSIDGCMYCDLWYAYTIDSACYIAFCRGVDGKEGIDLLNV